MGRRKLTILSPTEVETETIMALQSGMLPKELFFIAHQYGCQPSGLSNFDKELFQKIKIVRPRNDDCSDSKPHLHEVLCVVLQDSRSLARSSWLLVLLSPSIS